MGAHSFPTHDGIPSVDDIDVPVVLEGFSGSGVYVPDDADLLGLAIEEGEERSGG